MWFLSWLNPVKAAIEAIASVFNKKQDVVLEKYRVDGEVSIEAMRQDTELLKARTELAIVMKDDPTTVWGRRLFIYPTGAWYTSIIIYCIFHNAFPDRIWKIIALPSNLEYVPAAVVAYLLVTAWKK